MTLTFDQRRAAWLLETQRRTSAAQRRHAENAAAERGVEFKVDTYDRFKKPAPSSTAAVFAAPGVPPSPSAGGVAFRDERDWYELLRVEPKPRPYMESRRCFVPENVLITGGERSWRCEVQP